MLDVPEHMQEKMLRTKLQRRQRYEQRTQELQENMHIRGQLIRACIKPTKQRLILGKYLLSGRHYHITAEALHAQTSQTGITISLATVYNTLNQFAESGLIRKISISGQRSYFDTNAHNHQHFYLEDEDRMLDINGDTVQLDHLPQPPEGYVISKIDILISLKKRPQS